MHNTASVTTQIALKHYATEVCSHSHDFVQLVLPITGIFELEIGYQVGRVNANTAAYIPAGETHCFAGSQDNLFVVEDLPDHSNLMTDCNPAIFSELSSAAIKFLQFAGDYLPQTTHVAATDSFQSLLLNLVLPSMTERLDPVVKGVKQWINVIYQPP